MIGLIAKFSSASMPIGSVTIAIILGILINNVFSIPDIFKAGITFSEKRILSFAIVLMGVNLNFSILQELGYRSIFIVVAAVSITIFSALFLSRVFNFNKNFALLIGIGNGICGSSAIAAAGKVIDVNEEEIGVSIAIVNFLGTIGIFLLPLISLFLGLAEINSGMLIGNTLQAVGQVVASGFSVSEVSGQTATIVKMARILMLTPVIIILIFTIANNYSKSSSNVKKPGIPFFIIGFICFSLITTFGLLPDDIIKVISQVSKYSLIVAMAAIGLKISFSSILKNGQTALLIGSIVFVIQIIFSSSMILIFLK